MHALAVRREFDRVHWLLKVEMVQYYLPSEIGEQSPSIFEAR